VIHAHIANRLGSGGLIFSLFCLPVFAHKKKKRNKKMKAKTEAQYQAAAPKPVSYVRMYHSACFGRCPVYWVEVFSDGMVRYSGSHDSNPMGVYEKNIGEAATRNFLNTVAGYRIDTCRERYELLIADLPVLICNVTINGVTKTVYNAHFGPGYFRDMSREMDDLGQVDASWKKVADTAVYKL
jgi:hypothetical protein